ncbi:MAG: hypothetical protein ACJ07L_14980 [Opitutales bacterium]
MIHWKAMFEQTFKNIDDVLWKEAGCSSELDKDSLTLDWSLMHTEDLSVWEEIGKVEVAVPKQEVPYFFRFELNQ